MSSQTLTHLREYIVQCASRLISGALHQALFGMLSDHRIARQAQLELDQSFLSKASLSIEELEDLVILPAIGAESMRLSLLAAPPDVLYKITEDIWYQKFFLPKNSLIVFDRSDIFPSSTKLSDGQVLSD